uniref:transposase family protein n=1 Tax=Paenibacillus chitinolyticus TaxID=79263 RepID=UPI00295F0615|nr:transposase family protein [Paenibacillus chitinolyticus]
MTLAVPERRKNGIPIPAKISNRLKNVQIEQQPAVKLIERYNRSDGLIYADPPYILETRSKRMYKTRMDILNLSSFTVLSISENEHDFLIRVETNSPPSHCPHCGCVANLYKHSNREQLCMDLPIHGKRVGLLIKRQRYKCRECNQTFWERLDHIINEKRSCTKRLLSYVEKQSLKRTFVSISDDVGMNEKTGLAKQRNPKYQRRIDNYEREENFPMFKMPPVIREPEEITLLGIDLSTLIEKLEKGEL